MLSAANFQEDVETRRLETLNPQIQMHVNPHVQ